MDGVRDAVSDVAWSPAIATVFAAVTRDGHAQLWEASSLTPLIDQVGAGGSRGSEHQVYRGREAEGVKLSWEQTDTHTHTRMNCPATHSFHFVLNPSPIPLFSVRR